MAQQTNITAVQWLYNKMYEHRGNITIEEYEQAKQMEKEQIMDAYTTGYSKDFHNAQNYYDQKYGK